MGRIFGILGFLILLISLAGADALADYVKVRNRYHITQAVGVETLETLVGTRIIEIQGRVKGTMSTQAGHVLMLERTDGDYVLVESGHIPDWLQGNDVPARLVVRASRPLGSGELSAQLLAAATEYQVAPIDAANLRKAASVRKTPASRGGATRIRRS